MMWIRDCHVDELHSLGPVIHEVGPSTAVGCDRNNIETETTETPAPNPRL